MMMMMVFGLVLMTTMMMIIDYGYDGNDKGGFQKFLLQSYFSLLIFSL